MPEGTNATKGRQMTTEITTADVWVGEVDDAPTTLADKLEILLRAGANLEFAILRPSADIMCGKSLLFVAPLVGAAQERAAAEAGLERSAALHALRIVGPDRPGQIAGISRALAEHGIRISAVWAAAFADHSVQYIRFESGADAKRAAQLLAPVLV